MSKKVIQQLLFQLDDVIEELKARDDVSYTRIEEPAALSEDFDLPRYAIARRKSNAMLKIEYFDYWPQLDGLHRFRDRMRRAIE